MCQLFKAMGAGLSIKMSGYAKECFGYKLVSRNAQKMTERELDLFLYLCGKKSL